MFLVLEVLYSTRYESLRLEDTLSFNLLTLITGMKQKVFFKKKKVQLSRAVVSSRTEFSL